MEIKDMSYYDRFIAGLNLIREYTKHESLEPSHDVIEVWVAHYRPVPADVVARLKEYHWHQSARTPEKFYFFT